MGVVYVTWARFAGGHSSVPVLMGQCSCTIWVSRFYEQVMSGWAAWHGGRLDVRPHCGYTRLTRRLWGLTVGGDLKRAHCLIVSVCAVHFIFSSVVVSAFEE